MSDIPSPRADQNVAQHDNDFGKHIYVVPNPVVNTREFLKILYIYEVGYYSSVCAVKIAMYVDVGMTYVDRIPC